MKIHQDVAFGAIRSGLAVLARADNVEPGGIVRPNDVVAVGEHRSALDWDRTLVVGNRGMGKSFWTHALASPEAKQSVADTLKLPALKSTEVRIGFNASDRTDPVAPTPISLRGAFEKFKDAEAVWRAVLLRAASTDPEIPESFNDAVAWVIADPDRTDKLLTQCDERRVKTGQRLLVVFDALDRLAEDWKTTRALTGALLRRALAVRSYRAIRLKLFMRTDQYADVALFQFPDGSKIKNTRVDLKWSRDDLYTLLFDRLSKSDQASEAFRALRAGLADQTSQSGEPKIDSAKTIIDALAGEFMGTDKKRGRVFTWLPLHLSDAHDETSPRTFLTAWREAALQGEPPKDRAVDHIGLLEGVRKASEDRLQELKEDYWWIDVALAPLRNEMVPMDRATLESLWRRNDTASGILKDSKEKAQLAPVQLEEAMDPEGALLSALEAIGVMGRRSTGKIDVPDIFRVEAGIKRKGGVKPPRRPRSE